VTSNDYLILLIGGIAGLFLVTAVQGHSVGFFVGVNRIEWTPEREDDGVLDLWFCFWARIGMRRGANRR
jgi:hypothetical protein